jgi:hypothetical protein
MAAPVPRTTSWLRSGISNGAATFSCGRARPWPPSASMMGGLPV